jgi:hypothetical protein
MGRKKLHRTKDEHREQKRIRDKRYYQRHSNEIKGKRMQRYLEKKLSYM